MVGERTLARHRCTREDNIRTDLEEMGVRMGTGFIWLRVGSSGGQ
jgi:hypothetical protein